MKTILIAGAGPGFGHEVVLRLAAKGFDVIAGAEIAAQVQKAYDTRPVTSI
ncbi:hypothetical protein [Gluconobacter aidae]|uniref:hypothetical protein n=1 Tax=Gluconobacter aidae TaxID=2662454 RepID=UPI001E601A7A|nr:hypothetical protein [Gluconobacter aidae]